MMDLTTLTNDQIDEAIMAHGAEMTAEVDVLLTERARRIQVILEANLAAEKHYLATGEWPSEKEYDPTEIVRIRKLTPTQVYRCSDEHDFIEDLEKGHWVTGKTYIETTNRMVEALYSRVNGYSADDLAMYGNDTTEAESDMVLRSALVSREALSAKLAKAAGFDIDARNHKSACARYKKASHYDLMMKKF